MQIAPSILSADFSKLGQEVQSVRQAGATYLHIDIMDGHFVDNLTFGTGIVKAIRPYSDAVFDCHLMVDDAEKYLEDLKVAGVDVVGIHVESTKHIHRVLSKIHQLGLQAEVVINPGTPVSLIMPVLPLVDSVLVMTVDPGFGGQKFLKETLPKIKQLNTLRKELSLNYRIEVDGGINDKTISLVAQYDVDVAVAGSYVYGGNHKERITKLLKIANERD